MTDTDSADAGGTDGAAGAGSGLRLKRIQPRVLRQEVLEALRSAILAGDLPTGTRLLEA